MINWQPKKIFSVLFAILIGSCIVFFALKGDSISNTKNDLSSTNWKDSLNVVPQQYALRTLNAINGGVDIGGTGTTTTDLVAQRLLVEYMASQKSSATSTTSDVDAANIANILAQEVRVTEEKQYALSDVKVSSDNSRDANIAYINTVNTLVKNHMATEATENELTILMTAMSTGSVATLNKLDTKAAAYQQLINKLLALKTPSRIASIHLSMLQGFESLRSATIKMKDSLTDPTLGLAALSEYNNGVTTISSLNQQYNDYFSKQ